MMSTPVIFIPFNLKNLHQNQLQYPRIRASNIICKADYFFCLFNVLIIISINETKILKVYFVLSALTK